MQDSAWRITTASLNVTSVQLRLTVLLVWGQLFFSLNSKCFWILQKEKKKSIVVSLSTDGYCSTCSSSSLSLRSWDSSCLLWSSRICMRVSRRVLCCLRTRASARSSSSCCPPAVGEPRPSSPASVSMGTDAASSCFHLRRLYSLCSTLRAHRGQTGKKSQPLKQKQLYAIIHWHFHSKK